MKRRNNSSNILYLTYDGLTDSLGQSQILPYLIGLAKKGYSFTIISFEKKERFQKYRANIEHIISKADIKWVPLSFTVKPPLVSKFYDVLRMRRKAFRLYQKEKFAMVHCRSYIAADVGLRMKQKFGIKFFFDMRGFWADEKRDGGAWKENHPVFKRVYQYYKKKEAAYIQQADYIISLTHAGKKELQSWHAYISSVPVAVIPCCADMDHFTLVNITEKINGRKILGIDQQRFVLSYLGSVGSWYMLDEMLDFFSCLKTKYPDALFLFITHSDKSLILQKAREHQLDQKDILITEAGRNEVPVFMKASELTISFIKPVYSKISSSPTKLGEVLSMGIPVITNAGVGDVEFIVNQTNGGIVLKDFSIETMKGAINEIPGLLERDPESIREKARDFFDLGKGISLYTDAYRLVLEKPVN